MRSVRGSACAATTEMTMSRSVSTPMGAVAALVEQRTHHDEVAHMPFADQLRGGNEFIQVADGHVIALAQAGDVHGMFLV